MFKVSRLSCLTIGLLILLAACVQPVAPAAQPQTDANVEANTLVVSLSSEPTNLNPIYGDIYEGNWKIFNGLFKYDKDLHLLPDLAAELPEFSADGKTVTVKLRTDVKFHDNSSLTADDVAFTYNAILDPKAASPLSSQYDSLKEVKAIDPSTAILNLKIERGITVKEETTPCHRA